MGIAKSTPAEPKTSRSDQIAQEAARQFQPKFTGYFRGKDRPPVGRRLVGSESLNKPNLEIGDQVRTRDMNRRGVVESLELYRPFGEIAVYFRDHDQKLLRTPISNVVRIPNRG
jgi:hypothetical protein